MSSTNYTAFFDLCQWEPDDPVLREDFNADNQKIETAIVLNRPVTGTYTGTGSGSAIKQSISLGFRPRAVLAMPRGGYLVSGTVEIPFALAVDGADALHLVIQDDGFTVSGEVNVANGVATAMTNRNPHRFIAWR